jgi:hypothetical protein
MRFSWFFSVHPGGCRESTLKLGYGHFRPKPLQFTINLSPFHSTIYIVLGTEKASLNKLQITIIQHTADVLFILVIITTYANIYYILSISLFHSSRTTTFLCRNVCTHVTGTLTSLKLFINQESTFLLTVNLKCTLFSRRLYQAIVTDLDHDGF